VVLKIVSPDILHKTEIGGVLLDLRDAPAVRAGCEALLRRAREAAPEARIDGVLVAKMAPKGGVETIIGVARDPSFGPVVMFGLGGVFVEVLKDVTFRRAPFGHAEAHRMMREVRGFALLEGARGAPPCDVEALAETLVRVSRFAAANAATIGSIDINPYVVFPEGQGGVALDAVVLPA
jgi:acyl-CoA synthetase (NDP forming)